jgi:hypothetical protein
LLFWQHFRRGRAPFDEETAILTDPVLCVSVFTCVEWHDNEYDCHGSVTMGFQKAAHEDKNKDIPCPWSIFTNCSALVSSLAPSCHSSKAYSHVMIAQTKSITVWLYQKPLMSGRTTRQKWSARQFGLTDENNDISKSREMHWNWSVHINHV